jgi:hypothetical protein
MNPVLIILPLFTFLTLIFVYTKTNDYYGYFRALLKAYLSLYLFIVISTELLSFFNAITFQNILLSWLLLLAGGSVIARLQKRRGKTVPIPDFRKLLQLETTSKLILLVIILILAVTLLTGILYPPNNWDSMTYRMARVVNWISNSSVSFYPTAIDRQNYAAPLAEFAIMHLQILTGADLFANSVQWLSFLIVIILGILVSAELGFSKKQQLYTAVIIATLPMAILQASSTQNDLVVSGFIFSFAFYMLRLKERLSFENIVFASISLGLAFLTKGTAYIFCAGLGLMLGIAMLYNNKKNYRLLLKTTGILIFIVLFALLINAGHYSRNYDLYRHPLSTGAFIVSNSEHSLPAVLSNIIRNGAIHLATPSGTVNNYIYNATQALLGSQLDNPKITFLDETFVIRFSYHEDLAGNFIHMLLIMISIISLPMLWKKHLHLNTTWYSGGIVISVILYSLLFSWQPWASRLHTPFFILAAPLITLVLFSNKRDIMRIVGMLVLIAMVLYSMIFLLNNRSRPLLVRFSRNLVDGQVAMLKPDWLNKDRTELYFTNRLYFYDDYKNVTQIIKDHDQEFAGLYLDGDSWEYPLWVLANSENNNRKISFYHVRVSDISGNIKTDHVMPFYIIASIAVRDSYILNEYHSIYNGEYLSLWQAND